MQWYDIIGNWHGCGKPSFLDDINIPIGNRQGCPKPMLVTTRVTIFIYLPLLVSWSDVLTARSMSHCIAINVNTYRHSHHIPNHRSLVTSPPPNQSGNEFPARSCNWLSVTSSDWNILGLSVWPCRAMASRPRTSRPLPKDQRVLRGSTIGTIVDPTA